MSPDWTPPTGRRRALRGLLFGTPAHLALDFTVPVVAASALLGRVTRLSRPPT
ncbi:hypothetical protein [Streptomyces sp. NPDC002553]|uniref:hypothetical protein n=1 Tax=Streptomyces sp. NPDC002553 TaxID=3154417 RepID=UPI00331C29D4